MHGNDFQRKDCRESHIKNILIMVQYVCLITNGGQSTELISNFDRQHETQLMVHNHFVNKESKQRNWSVELIPLLLKLV